MIKVYVGNTVKIDTPLEVGKEIVEVKHISSDSKIAKVNQSVVIGLKKGEVTITSKVTFRNKGEDKLEYQEWETNISVIVGKFKLKTVEATKYLLDKTQTLKEREATVVSIGKTARIYPAIIYGVFSKVTYESDDESIATVVNDGLIGLVTGHSLGKATITATADINGYKLKKSIVIKVMKTKIPVQNPKNASEYSKKDDWSGDRVYFGVYEQDNLLANGPEPICWRVLEVTSESILLLSEYGLESKNFNDSFEPVTWETCTLRSWLNTTFVNKAFTNYEQTAILNSKITNPDNKKWGTKGGNDTIDKVFLLSDEEVTNPNYGFYSNFREASATRAVKNTEYATVFDGYTNKSNGNTCWWLRTPGVEAPFAAYIFTNGGGTYSYFVGRRNDAVRPAIRLKLSDISFAINELGQDYPYIVVDGLGKDHKLRLGLVGYDKPEIESALQAYAVKYFLKNYPTECQYCNLWKADKLEDYQLIDFMNKEVGFMKNTDISAYLMINYKASVVLSESLAPYRDFYQFNFSEKEKITESLFLCDLEDYKKIINTSSETSDYILVDCTSSSSNLLTIAQKLGKSMKIDVITFAKNCKIKGIVTNRTSDPSEYLGLISGAKFVITDSFMTLWFTLLNRIPFIAHDNPLFPGKNKKLLKRFGLLEHYMVKKVNNVDEYRLKNEKEIEKLIAKLKKTARENLLDCLPHM